MDSTIVEQVVEQLRDMPQEKQQQVLQFTRALAGTPPPGVAGKYLLPFAGTISDHNARELIEAIEHGCE